MNEFLRQLGIEEINHGACFGSGNWIDTTGSSLVSRNPTDDQPIGEVRICGAEDYETVVTEAGKPVCL